MLLLNIGPHSANLTLLGSSTINRSADISSARHSAYMSPYTLNPKIALHPDSYVMALLLMQALALWISVSQSAWKESWQAPIRSVPRFSGIVAHGSPNFHGPGQLIFNCHT